MPRKKASNPADAPSTDAGTCAPATPHQTITLCMRKTGRPPSATITGPAAVCARLRDTGMDTADRENAYVLHLNARNQIIGTELVARGHLTGVDLHPREVFKGAVLNNAAAIILAHNHPSGNASPSAADIEVTERLGAAGKVLGVPLLDHVVVTADECASLRQSGRLPEHAFGATYGTAKPKGKGGGKGRKKAAPP